MDKGTNGCGPDGNLGKLIPDGLLGVSIEKACNLHDEQYSIGGRDSKRKKADDLFLKNILLQVEAKGGSILIKGVRKALAYTYYYSVRIFGGFLFQK